MQFKPAMMLRLTLPLLAMTLFVSACVTNGQHPVADSFCATEQQRILTEHDVATLPIAELRAILERNEYGAKRCGWKGVSRSKEASYWGSVAGYIGGPAWND